MTLAEKLRFLADRAEDRKEFYISTFTNNFFFNEEDLIHTEDDDGFVHKTAFKIDMLLRYDFTLKKPIVFTEDERVILRNLPDEFRWIARDEYDNRLYVYTIKPTKIDQHWLSSIGSSRPAHILPFKDIFQSIKGSDDEPCEFRRFL